MEFKDVMVDIETMGLQPGCAILSIGAVAFDPNSVAYSNRFYRNIDLKDCIEQGFIVDPSTEKWWNEQSDEAKAHLQENQLPILAALADFCFWYKKTVQAERIWCHGASFDVPIIGYAINQLGGEIPWNYKDVRDTRTLYDLADFDPSSIERVGTHHNALGDAISQVRCVQKAMQKLLKYGV